MATRQRLHHRDSDSSTTIYKEEYAKLAKHDKRYVKLREHIWGIGLEHETQLFHTPSPEIYKKNMIKDFIMVDTLSFIIKHLQILKKRSQNGDNSALLDIEFLKGVPYEPTGRKCNGKTVINKAPYDMPEFITGTPFSSLVDGKRSIESYCEELKDNKARFISILNRDSELEHLRNKYGDISNFAYGFMNYIKFSNKVISDKSKNPKYIFAKNKLGEDVVREDYLGSFHITITLPHTTKTTAKQFISMHQNYANMLQWLEPLLVAIYFSSDQKAMGTDKLRVRGSPRILKIGWGNLAGSDVRKFTHGIGRYSVIKSHWRDGLEYHDKKRLTPCLGLTPPAIREKGISALSSDFRTFGSTDPDRPWHRVSGAPMTKPNGIEFRIFDQFSNAYLTPLCILMIYIAENSKRHKARQYVYQNKGWIGAVHSIMMHGWLGRVPDEYVVDLRQALGLKIRTKTRIAYYLFKAIVKELWQINKKGDWAFLMLNKEYNKPPMIPDINEESWNMGFMIKMNRNPIIRSNFNKFTATLKKHNNKKLSFDDCRKIYLKYFSEKMWGKNYEDILYFLLSMDYVKLSHRANKDISSITPKGHNIRNNNDYSDIIAGLWQSDLPYTTSLV
jgi:hypothetical protein